MYNLKKKLSYIILSIRENWLLISVILIGILSRIPRTNSIYGSDCFEVIWMAKAFNFGALTGEKTWLINPLSFFGIYPYSHYPILVPLILAVFLYFQIPLFLSLYIINSVLLFFGILGSYFLSKEFFKKRFYQFMFTVIYLFSTDYYILTYNIIHPRAFVLSLNTWFLFFLFQTYKTKRTKNILISIILFFIMVLSHRIALATLIYPIILLTISFFLKFKAELVLEKKLLKILLFVTIVTIALLSLLFFGVTTGSLFLIFPSFNPFFSNLLSLLINYFIRIGIASCFIPFGIFFIFVKEKDILKKFFLMLSLIAIAFSFSYAIYNILIFLPIYCAFAVKGYDFIYVFFSNEIKNSCSLMKRNLLVSIFLLIFSLLFAIIYSIVICNVLDIILIYISLIFTVLLFSLIFKNRIRISRNLNSICCFFLLIIILLSSSFFSITVFEGRIRYSNLQIPYSMDFSVNYISDEEYLVVDFIEKAHLGGIILVSSLQIARRIGAIGFFQTLPGDHFAQQLYYGWINADDVKGHTYFDFRYFLNHFNLKCDFPNFEREILSKIKNLNIAENDSLHLLIELKIQFIVIIKYNNTVYPYHISLWGQEFFPFYQSLANKSPSFSTDHLLVWKIY